MPTCSVQEWESFVEKCSDVHILQSPSWGILKSKFGWKTTWLVTGNIGAQVLFQPLLFGYHFAYIPKGPISPQGWDIDENSWNSFQRELDEICRSHKTIFLKIEPDSWESQSSDFNFYPGYRKSSHSIQPLRTILISLEESEDEILARMKSKTRYNIRLAAKKKVMIRQLNDIQPFYQLLEKTSNRADFGIHTQNYYQTVFDLFNRSRGCKLFLAEYQNQPLASIMVFVHGKRSWYFYGASSGDHRERMPTYLVQWEAMRWAKQNGCLSYDLWGVPDHDQETLEGQFLDRQDGLWGVYRFKRGFGGDLIRSGGPWDRVYRPLFYSAFQLFVKAKELSR